MKAVYYEDEDGTKFWYLSDEQEWYINQKLHREDGPAIIYADGSQLWYLNGNLHREDGPAIIYADGTQEWYQSDKDITDEVNQWFEDHNITYDTMADDEKLIFSVYINCIQT